MLKSDSALTVIDQQGRTITSVDAPVGPALFAFSIDGSTALAYFQQSKTLAVWDGHAFQAIALDIDDTVLSISWSAALIVQRDTGLWELGVELATGAIVWQTALPGVTAPVLMLASGGLLYRDAKGVVVRSVDGTEKHIAAHLPARLAFGQMGDGWVQVTDLASGRMSALNIQPGHEAYYLLPEVRQ
jgi:hypothetical protein